jgi:hypothetical protein
VAGEIHVHGLAEFRRNLRRIDRESAKGIRLAGNEAARLVVADARPRVPVGPAAGGHALTNLRASSTATAARVSFGSKRYSYGAWLEFGGRVGRKRSVHRPFIREGRYMFPAYHAQKPNVERELHRALVEVAHRAGVSVS